MRHVLRQIWWPHSHWIFALQHQYFYWIRWHCKWSENVSKAVTGPWLWLMLRAWLLAPARLHPAWLLLHGAQLGDLGSLPRLRDTAATFPFASSTSSKAEHVSQRHTHRGCWQGQTHRTPWTRLLHSTAPTYRTHTRHKHRQPCPLLPFQLVETEGH